MVECFVVVEGSSAFVCCTLAILHILEEQSGCIRISTFDFLDVRQDCKVRGGGDSVWHRWLVVRVYGVLTTVGAITTFSII